MRTRLWPHAQRLSASGMSSTWSRCNVSRKSGADCHSKSEPLWLQDLGDGESCVLGGDDSGLLGGSGHEDATGDLVRAA